MGNNTYMIGDLVKIAGNVAKITLPCPNCSMANVDGVCVPSRTEDIEGIELTNQILKKNGWRDDLTRQYEKHNWMYGNIHLYDKQDNDGYLFLYSGGGTKYIRFVHELQHLLFALGYESDLNL